MYFIEQLSITLVYTIQVVHIATSEGLYLDISLKPVNAALLPFPREDPE